MNTPSPWQTTPRKSAVIFLLAVFFVFASFGFAGDSMDMGHQPPLRFAISVVLSGLFAVAYAATGITLRSKFWMALIPIFAMQFVCFGLLANWFPEAPRPAVMDAAETERLQGRLVFDGLAIIVSICLGYAGFVYVSISEGRRHIRAQTEKAMLEGEMAAAREVQQRLVAPAVDVPGFRIESAY